jgi:hypothetical protein
MSKKAEGTTNALIRIVSVLADIGPGHRPHAVEFRTSSLVSACPVCTVVTHSAVASTLFHPAHGTCPIVILAAKPRHKHSKCKTVNGKTF